MNGTLLLSAWIRHTLCGCGLAIPLLAVALTDVLPPANSFVVVNSHDTNYLLKFGGGKYGSAYLPTYAQDPGAYYWPGAYMVSDGGFLSHKVAPYYYGGLPGNDIIMPHFSQYGTNESIEGRFAIASGQVSDSDEFLTYAALLKKYPVLPDPVTVFDSYYVALDQVPYYLTNLYTTNGFMFTNMAPLQPSDDGIFFGDNPCYFGCVNPFVFYPGDYYGDDGATGPYVDSDGNYQYTTDEEISCDYYQWQPGTNSYLVAITLYTATPDGFEALQITNDFAPWPLEFAVPLTEAVDVSTNYPVYAVAQFAMNEYPAITNWIETTTNYWENIGNIYWVDYTIHIEKPVFAGAVTNYFLYRTNQLWLERTDIALVSNDWCGSTNLVFVNPPFYTTNLCAGN